ncbi:MAG: hypothetical protein ABG776_12370 [Cyanobacteria bacterium J06555_13]
MNGDPSNYPFRQYVWALGHGTNKVPIGELIDHRYQVIAPLATAGAWYLAR